MVNETPQLVVSDSVILLSVSCSLRPRLEPAPGRRRSSRCQWFGHLAVSRQGGPVGSWPVDGPGREAVVRRLAALADAGRLGSGQVRSAAGALGVSERTVWRWVGQARAGEGLDRPSQRVLDVLSGPRAGRSAGHRPDRRADPRRGGPPGDRRRHRHRAGHRRGAPGPGQHAVGGTITAERRPAADLASPRPQIDPDLPGDHPYPRHHRVLRAGRRTAAAAGRTPLQPLLPRPPPGRAAVRRDTAQQRANRGEQPANCKILLPSQRSLQGMWQTRVTCTRADSFGTPVRCQLRR